MSIFSGLFSSRDEQDARPVAPKRRHGRRLSMGNMDKPKNSTSGSSYRFVMGGSTSGKPVNERSAMQMTAVYSCVRILSEAVASLPLHIYTYTQP